MTNTECMGRMGKTFEEREEIRIAFKKALL